jgi:hypothetical protein
MVRAMQKTASENGRCTYKRTKKRRRKNLPLFFLTDSLMQKLQQIKWVCVSVSLGIRMPERRRRRRRFL